MQKKYVNLIKMPYFTENLRLPCSNNDASGNCTRFFALKMRQTHIIIISAIYVFTMNLRVNIKHKDNILIPAVRVLELVDYLIT
jgi:hypothetical protein